MNLDGTNYIENEREIDMWIMTHFGILMPSLRPEDTYNARRDTRHIQIRARRARELDYLRENYAPFIGETVFIGDTDYQFRAYCTHEQLAEIMGMLAREIDYVKFKPTTDRHGDTVLHRVYNSIWCVVLEAWPGGSSYDFKPRKRKARKSRNSGKRNSVDEVVVTTGGRNEYADFNPLFKKRWWEDL